MKMKWNIADLSQLKIIGFTLIVIKVVKEQRVDGSCNGVSSKPWGVSSLFNECFTSIYDYR